MVVVPEKKCGFDACYAATVTEWIIAPLVPVTIMMYGPATVFLLTAMVRTEV